MICSFISFQFIRQKEWIQENFPKDTRYETIIISTQNNDGNILTAEAIQYVIFKSKYYNIHIQIFDYLFNGKPHH
jgi:hypothetical protein